MENDIQSFVRLKYGTPSTDRIALGFWLVSLPREVIDAVHTEFAIKKIFIGKNNENLYLVYNHLAEYESRQ